VPAPLVAVCDLDGTLLDSDEALLAPFLALGVARESIGRGLPVAEECARHGVTVDDYVAAYDTTVVTPYPGVAEMVAGLGRWAVCSNKHPSSGRAELGRLGWNPELALFTDAFDGPKRLGPVLEALGVGAQEVVFLGDTGHDRACAAEVGARFALAGWNPRAEADPEDVVLRRPADLLALLRTGATPT
jgi:phosphoglycolate phosphatase-like HAD superfamily hydrolase